MRKTERILSFILVALMMLQSLTGLLYQHLYRDVAWIKLTWLGNDLVTLIIVVPILFISILRVGNQSRRAMMLWLGTIGYGIYNYAFYLFGASLNVFFPLYVLTFVISIITMIISLSHLDIRFFVSGFRNQTPVRSIGGYYVFVAVCLSMVWLGMWFAYIFYGRATPVDTETFKLVAALDTTLMVSSLLVGGIFLWQRNRWGFILSCIAGVQSSLYLLVLTINSGVSILQGFGKWPGELPIWGTLLLLTILATCVLFFNIVPRYSVIKE
ncbi:MAG: hypothetical protein GZ091_07710 [Paludibacter sp.]|nr:hypothetical protein [Paludibacter sp.]